MPAHPRPLRGVVEADVVVLGAGLAGLTAAVAAARPGRRVVVLGVAQTGTELSEADLGHVGVGIGEPYLLAGERLGRARARALWEWHRESHERLFDGLAGAGEACGYRSQGGFLLALDREEAIALADSEDALRDDGFPGEFLDHYMLEARFDVQGFTGAYWAADEAEVDGAALLQHLRARVERSEVAFYEVERLTELGLDPDRLVASAPSGEIRASRGVLALAAAGDLIPDLAGLLRPRPVLRAAFDTGSGSLLPSPGRTLGGALHWRTGRGLRAMAIAAGEGGPVAAFERLTRDAARHLGAREPHEPCSFSLETGAAGLPLVGPFAGTPLYTILGLGTLAHAWAFGAARRAADWLDGRPASFDPLAPSSDPVAEV